MKCLICHEEKPNERSLATHLQLKHKIKSLEYTINHLYGGIRPLCPVCQTETRYVSFSFKTYCKEHSFYAESQAGHIGGKVKNTWNKGQTKETNETIKEQALKQMGSNNPFYGKYHNEEFIKQKKISERITEKEFIYRINKRQSEFDCLTSYSDYTSRQKQKLLFKCLKCNEFCKKTLMAFERGSLCPKCFPNIISKPELEVRDFIISCGIKDAIFNDRKLIHPKELDIYIPSKNFAIEFNGLYFHTIDKVGKKHHLSKTEECKKNNVKLFHIFSDEWINRPNIIKSMIKHRLNISEKNIYARKCEIRFLNDNKTQKDFFYKTHISGGTNSKIAWGLFYEDELICCLSAKKPIQKKYYNTIEISRFSCALDTNIVGGFSKLFKQLKKWCIENNKKHVLTYADRRFGEGNVYLKNGFTFKNKSSLDYWYVKQGEEKRYFRFKFRAQFGKSEKRVALENGMIAICGCGNNIYIYDII